MSSDPSWSEVFPYSNPDQEGGLGDQKSTEFWEHALDEAKSSFERGVTLTSRTIDHSIEFMKLNILIASVYAAAIQFLPRAVSSGSFAISLPFIPIALSLFLQFYIYFKLSSFVAGPSEGNLQQAFEEDFSTSKYLSITAIVYYRWNEDNASRRNRTSKLLALSLGMSFAALLMMVILIAF